MRTVLLLSFIALLARAAVADTLALRDGRFIENRPIESTDKGFVVTYKHGKILVPKSLVAAYFKAGAPDQFIPTTEEEKAKFAKGLLPYRGRWVLKTEWERLQKEAAQARKKHLEQMKERRLWRNHAVTKTRRFEFRYTVPDDVFKGFEELFETYYDFYRKYWHVSFDPHFGGPVVVNIFHSEQYFDQVSGAPPGVVGYYSPLERDLNFYYDRENYRYTIDVMFHEGNHMLTHMLNKNMWYPWWISEGMAEYFGASEWDPKTKTMKLGRIQSGRLAVLHAEIKDGHWLKLKDLLSADRMGAIGYSWAWSFCHFMLHTPKYERNFRRYFLAIAHDTKLRKVPAMGTMMRLAPDEQIDSFKLYLHIRSIDELQKEWYGYINDKLSLKGRDIDWGEAGEIMAMYGEQAKARLYYKRAIDAGSERPSVLYGYAELKMEQNMPHIAAKYAKMAVEADPLHARAWSLRGEALHAIGQTDEGFRMMELATELDPDDSQVWFNLEAAREMDKAAKEAAGAPPQKQDPAKKN